jgi:FkbH-like protein
MFELHIPHRRWPRSQLPDEVKARFRDFDAEIRGVSLAPWGEHCSECALPECYTSCDLYAARPDGKCRRFAEGIELVPDAPTVQGYLVRVAFKRWAQLMAFASVHVVPLTRARRVERLFRWLDALLAAVPDGALVLRGHRAPSKRIAVKLKDWVTRRRVFADPALAPDYFLIEAFNPGPETLRLCLTLQNPPAPDRRPPLQKLFEITPGFHRYKIDYAEIAPHVDAQQLVWIHLIPNVLEPEHEGRALYFGTLGFVSDARWRSTRTLAQQTQPRQAAARVKVVAWDLDGTLWDGILLEDGPEGVKLRAEVAEVVRSLDRRGIVSTAVSKNEPEDALAQLARYALADYFVFPQIGWRPKSEALAAVARDFNVGVDTLAFVDDSPFEREQVRSALPSVRVYDAAEAAGLPQRPEFDVPRTDEASRRRAFYREQQARSEAMQGFSGEYLEFLRSCEIRLTVHTQPQGRIDRLHELVQRTNQLNFSGNRYTRDDLEALLREPDYEAYAMACEDRFGAYGIIGFALVEQQTPRLVDLALSCRVQAKRIEHAFLAFLLARHRERGAAALEALYRRTERNRAAGAVFEDLGFQELTRSGGTRHYRIALGDALPREELVRVEVVA